MKKKIALIPARCGSKSIPLKNIKLFCGEPLIFWCASALQNTPEIDEIHVATDCDEIANLVLSFGFSKLRVFERNKENAGDDASTESLMLEFLAAHTYSPDTRLILVQATSPFTTSSDFTEAISKLEASSADSMLSCVRLKRFFWDEHGESKNYDFRNRPRRQDFKGSLLENGAFYINSVGNILRDSNRLSGKIGYYEMPEYAWIELDEEDDWLTAERVMRKHLLSNTQVKKIKLFATDVDGVLTDAGMYYAENGLELKKFNTHDGKGIELVRKAGVKTAILTSEKTEIVSRRAEKLKIDYVFQGLVENKLQVLEKLCMEENIGLDEVAYIGDDINCIELLQKAGVAACPANSLRLVKEIPHIICLKLKGGEGVVREFIEHLFLHKYL